MLLEVLVAFVIAALALTVLYSVASTGLRSVAVAGQYEEALTRARSHLAAIGVDGALTPGEQQGNDGNGFHYEVQISQIAAAPVTLGGRSGAAVPQPVLYLILVAISWHEGTHARVVRLATERVEPAPAPPP